MNWFNVVEQRFTADNYVLNVLFYDEGWNPFLWPPWQSEGEMAGICPSAPPAVSED